MNILFYYSANIDPIQGGIQKVTYTLGRYFLKQGMQVHYIAFKKTSEYDLPNQHYLPNSINLHSGENRDFYMNLIEKKNINVVIMQSGADPNMANFIFSILNRDVKIISVIHSSLYGIYSHGFPFLFIPYFQFKYGKSYRKMHEKSSRIVVLSEHFINEFKQFAKIKNEQNKIVAIANPLDMDNSQKKSSKKEKIILYVGRFSEEKQVHLLISIWEIACKKFSDWSLILVGNGSKKAKVEKLAKEKKLERVSFEGFQNPEPYYAKSSLLALTSKFEGFGMVLIEAMAFGTVPLAFNSYKSVADIIDNKENGILAKPFSLKEYAGNLMDLMGNEKKRQIMAENAIKKSKNFSVENIGKKWMDLLQEVNSEK